MTHEEDNALVKRPSTDLLKDKDALDEIELDGKTDPIKKHPGEIDFFYGLGVMYHAVYEGAQKASISVSLGTLLLGIGLLIMSKFGIENRIVICIGTSLFCLGAIAGRQIDRSIVRNNALKDIKSRLAIIALQNKAIASTHQNRLLLDGNERTLSEKKRELEDEFNKQNAILQYNNTNYLANAKEEVLAEAANELSRLNSKNEQLQAQIEEIKKEIEEKKQEAERLSSRNQELKLFSGMISDSEMRHSAMAALEPLKPLYEERSAVRLEELKAQVSKPTGKKGSRT